MINTLQNHILSILQIPRSHTDISELEEPNGNVKFLSYCLKLTGVLAYTCVSQNGGTVSYVYLVITSD